MHNSSHRHTRTIALLPWGDVWDDFLDSVNISLESFCTEGPGGWMLGFMDALSRSGVRTVLILISARVDHPVRYQLASTGSTITVLPATRIYRAIRSQMVHPNTYLNTGSFDDVYGPVRGFRRLWFQILNQLAAFLVTPLGLVGKELRRESCQAILCQEYESPRFDVCVMLAALMGLPVFATFQGRRFDPNLFGRLLRQLLTIKLCRGLAIGSQTEIQRVHERYNLRSSKIAQIFNPIDLHLWQKGDRFDARAKLSIPQDACVVLWHGRVDFSSKGLGILLDAWEQICNQRDRGDLRLMLMGTGKDSGMLHSRIRQHRCQNIFFIDQYISERSQILRFLSAGDIYAFPSLYEGFPVAPIEAMACGLPLVAASASGIPDILEGVEAAGGLIVPTGDVHAFAHALGYLLDHPDLMRSFGERARRRVEEAFSLGVVGQQLKDFIFKPGCDVSVEP